MEVLSCLLKREKEGGYLLGFRVSGRGGEVEKVSHLLFADDTFIFYKANQDQMVHLSWLLMWFKAISSLKINFEKSKLILVGRVDNAEELTYE